MKKMITAICTVAGLMGAVRHACAAAVTLEFSDNPFPAPNPTAYAQHNIDANANDFFRAQYGVDFNNTYLFYSAPSSNPAMSGFGLANGTVSKNFVRNTVGRVNFMDATSFLSFDYVALMATTFKAFGTDGNLLDSFTATPQDSDHVAVGTHSFLRESGPIAYMTFASTGGFGTIKRLNYEIEGAVPEPQALILLLAGMATCTRLIQRRQG